MNRVILFFVFIYTNDSIWAQIENTYTKLVWNDECNGTGNIDTTKWHHQTLLPNGNSWYNGEVQHYTNRIDNSSQINGNLRITAKKENFTHQGITKNYTSARLNSKFSFTYGKVEIRAKVPVNQGTWPAIWTLGKNINEAGAYFYNQFGTTNWPACGEIDIMEAGIYGQANKIGSAIHTTSSSGSTINSGGRVVSDLGTNFHIYTLIWTPDKISFALDSQVYYTYNPSIKNASTWPFDSPQYILLNIAMGGVAGSIPATFSQAEMDIDYIRIYQKEDSIPKVPSVVYRDTLAPTNFTAELGIIGSQSIALNLNAKDTSGPITYEIKYNGQIISTTSNSEVVKSFTLSNLVPETDYTLEIKANDTAGNKTTAITLNAKTLVKQICEGQSNQAQQGTFSIGYTYSFEQLGNDLKIEYQLLDTDKTGIVAFLQTQSPASEVSGVSIGNNKFSFIVSNFTSGTLRDFAVKFSYSGGFTIGKFINYTYGQKCSLNINENDNLTHLIFNNPASKNLNLKSSSPIENLQIFNLLGKETINLNSPKSSIEISQLPTGIYPMIIRINNLNYYYHLQVNE